MTDQEKALKLKELFLTWQDAEEILYQMREILLEPDMSMLRLVHLLSKNAMTAEEATAISRHLQLFIRTLFGENLFFGDHSEEIYEAAHEA